MAELTRPERDAILARIFAAEAQIFAPGGFQGDLRAFHRVNDGLKEAEREYVDRLPRIVLGACPFTGDALRRSIDPFGLDGPWWRAEAGVEMQEPAAPETFRMLSGAMDLRGRPPAEAQAEILPGPPVPFVIPRVLDLPGMVAVIAALDLPNGDRIYPISYWSPHPVEPRLLHTPWLRATYWLPDGGGWMVCNARWDFDLKPWLDAGKVRWIMPGDTTWTVREGRVGCPFVDLPGHRGPQSIDNGRLYNDDPSAASTPLASL